MFTECFNYSKLIFEKRKEYSFFVILGVGGWSLGSTEMSFRCYTCVVLLSYLCRTGVISRLLYYSFLEIARITVSYPYLCPYFLGWSVS